MREFTEHDAAVIGAGTHGHGVRPKRRRPRPVLTAAAVVALAGLAWWAEAQEARQQEQDTARVLLANRWLSKDPTRAALVLLEIENPDETPYAIATMIEALGQPLTRFIFPDGHIADGLGASTLAVFSPDGTKVVTARGDRALVWNTDGSGEPVVLNGAGRLQTAAFNADGTKVVTVSQAGPLVWNTDGSGEPVVLNGAGNPKTVAFNPDGTKIVAACGDHTARVWNVGVRPTDGPEGRTPGEPVVLRGHRDRIHTAAFSPDGTKIVTASDDETARVWNVDGSGQPVILRGHEDVVTSAAFSADGTKIVTASDDETARVWNVGVRPTDDPEGRTAGEPVVLRGHKRPVSTAAFSPDGTKIVTASDDKTARVWNVDGSGVPVVLRGHESWVLTAAFSPDGAKVVTASRDGTARVWNADGPDGRTPGEPVVLRGNERGVVSAAFHADGTTVLTVSAAGTVRVWDMDWEPVVLKFGSVRVGDDGFPEGAALNADGTKVLTAEGSAARVWNADGSGVPVVLEHEERVSNAAFSPDGTKVLTTESGEPGVSREVTLRVWNADGPEGRTPGLPVVLGRHEDTVWSAAFSADGTKVVTASEDKTARVWNVDGSGKPVVLRGHDDAVKSAAFNADGTKVVTASEDKTARVWNVDGPDGPTPGEPVVLREHDDAVERAAFNADGTKVVTASRDETARVWHADGSGEPVVLRGHDDPVWSAAFNADGTKILTLSMGLALVWNVDGPEGRTPGKPVVLRRLIHPVDNPHCAAFNPDGTKVVTGSAWSGRGAVRVWNADGSGVPLLLEGHAGWVGSVAFSGDGTKVVITSTDGTAWVWTVAGASLQAAIRETTSACLDPFFRVSFLEEPPILAWKRYAECEISHDRCPASWRWVPYLLQPTLEALPISERDRFWVEASERYLSQLSKEARERYEECMRRHADF